MESCHGRCFAALEGSKLAEQINKCQGATQYKSPHRFNLRRPAPIWVLVLACSFLVLGVLGAPGAQFHPGHDADSSWSSAFVGTLLMIICSELGDKTFLIVAVLSMRCSKSEGLSKACAGGKGQGSQWHVFAGAFLALALMTILAAAGGRVLPFFLKQQLRTIFMVSLLVIFGIKMLHEAAVYVEDPEEPGLLGVAMQLNIPGKERMLKELKELSRAGDDPTNGNPLRRLASNFFSPVFIQAASLTLVAEWGDRSQLATFALAADKSASAVCLGAMLGHGLCTALAVVGGNVLAKRISERVLLVLGGICFLSFAALTMCGEHNASGTFS